MVEKENKPNTKMNVIYFPVDENNHFVQMQSTMTETNYKKLCQAGEGEQEVVINPGKGKMLIQVLDKSGSMYGRPEEALREGAKLIGNAYTSAAQAPFEHFITIAYDHEMTEYVWNGNVEEYRGWI
jgi:uncharacterized protein with von Willebrand factor type A (vWA) domain